MGQRKSNAAAGVALRTVGEGDLAAFFVHQLDADANRMAAFTPADPSDQGAFRAHWRTIIGSSAITKRTILCDNEVVGHIMVYPHAGELEVTYWIGKAYWGKGVATNALLLLLNDFDSRPLYARAAKDNLGSIRVLQKCGFSIVGEDTGFAAGRGEVVEEHILRLNAIDPLQT